MFAYGGSGGTPSSVNRDYYNGDIPFLNISDLKERNIRFTEKQITTLGLRNSAAWIVPAGSISLAMYASVGKVGIICNDTATSQAFYNMVVQDIFVRNFLYTRLEKADAYNEWEPCISTGTQRNLNAEKVKNFKIKIPSRHEMNQIGSIFEVLDSLITLHQRKLDALKKIKSALLEKMFPKDGSNIPEIRFTGFTEAWEQRKFSTLVTIERGGSPRPIDDFITNLPNGLNWVKIGDAPVMGRYITSTSEKIKPEGLSKTRQVFPGDLVLSNSMSFGRPYIMAIEGCIHDGWLLIRDTQKIFDSIYLCHMLGTSQMLNQYRMFAAGSTVNNLNINLVGNANVYFPILNEQERIGSILNNFDNLITLHQRKLDALKKIKSALLEKMFV